MTNVYIDDIVEIKPPHFKYTSMGKVICLHPIKCVLESGDIVDVNNCELKVLRRELVNKFKKLFRKG